MRAIDMHNMEVVYKGEPWLHATLPCSKQAIPLLERNEKVVSWVSPEGGSVNDHIPCILFRGKYYSLSLRMQKAIYRHVRLKKGFRNEEIMDGVAKLRIPDVLLKEKIRTQSRFDAMRKKGAASSAGTPREEEEAAAAATAATAVIATNNNNNNPNAPKGGKRMGGAAAAAAVGKRDRNKTSCTVSARMRLVVDQMLNCDEEQYASAVQQATIFVFKSQQSELITCFLEEMRRENSALFRDKASLVRVIAETYDVLV